MPTKKLPGLWKPTPGSSYHCYLGKKKVNLRTHDLAVADERRRALKAGTLTPEAIPGAPRMLPPLAAAEAAPDAVQAAFERMEAPAPPEMPQEAPSAPQEAPAAPVVTPDAYRSAEGWHEALGETAAPPPGPEEPPPGANFDGGELLDMAAKAITDFTETIARGVLANRGRRAPVLGDDFPLKPILQQSWAAQLRIWCPTDTALTPGTGIMIGTLGIWALMFAGSEEMSDVEKAAQEAKAA